MHEARREAPVGNGGVPPRVFGTALATGILLASLVSVAARLETGYPPGITPPPFARLIGQPAPAFALDALQGGTVSSDDAPAGRSWLLFFADASCQACDATYPALAQASERYPVVVVGAGDRSVLQEKLDPHGLVSVTGHDRLWAVNQAYGVPGYPSVLLIDPQGVVRQGAVGTQGLEQVLAPSARQD